MCDFGHALLQISGFDDKALEQSLLSISRAAYIEKVCLCVWSRAVLCRSWSRAVLCCA